LRYLIVDAITDQHLCDIGEASVDLELITGGSGIALGLPANFRRAGLLSCDAAASTLQAPAGRSVIIAGSCSAMTRQQVAHAQDAGVASFRIDPMAVADKKLTAAGIAEWVMTHSTAESPALVYSSAEPAEVLAIQEKLGRQAAGHMVEHLLGETAQELAARGFSRFVVAGGETSGAVVAALGVEALRIGPEIDPGVPWTTSLGGQPLALALKSGNFGAPDFFLKAWKVLA
jgi:uncharacterized protein YgbK (DUF1537 family)